MSNLIPNLEKYVDLGANVLLIGKHGVGKTQSLKELAAKKGLKVKYFSCSTLDPFTDLVGIPYPDEDGKSLTMIRPKEIDEANIVFFDELNRAQDTKTLNAILEIVQFRSINGEVLPNLISCWAAVNPAEEGYQVQDLDPALVDRFDVYFDLEPKVSVQYLAQHMPSKIAQALFEWWKEGKKKKNEHYISPRRIEKIGRMVEATQSAETCKAMLPPNSNHDSGKLIYNLNVALGKIDPYAEARKQAKLVKGKMNKIVYTKGYMAQNAKNMAAILRDPNCGHDTILQVRKIYEKGTSADTMVKLHADILEALPKSELEALFNGWDAQKRSGFRGAVKSYAPKAKYPNLNDIII